MSNPTIKGKFGWAVYLLIIGFSVIWVHTSAAKQTLSAPTLTSPENNSYFLLLDLTNEKLEWTSVVDAVTYEISVTKQGETVPFDIFKTKNTSFLLVDLYFAGKGEIKVRGINELDEPGEWSEILNIEIYFSAPELVAPENNIMVKLSELNQVKLECAEVVGAVTYEFLIEHPQYFRQEFTRNTFLYMQSTTYVGTYTWKVRARNSRNVYGELSESRNIEAVFAYPTETNTPTPVPTADADFNDDGAVDYNDIMLFSKQWYNENKYDDTYDLDNNYNVDTSDLLLVLDRWRFGKQVTPSPTPLVGVPNLSNPADGSIITFSGINDTTFEWSAVPNAVRYTIRFIDPQNVVSEYVVGTNCYPVTTGFLFNGTYEWQVRAELGDGTEGEFSAKWTFILISDPTPTPTPLVPANPDLYEDNKIDNLDLYEFTRAWKSDYYTGVGQYNGRADFEYDRKIDEKDLVKFIKAWKRRAYGDADAPILLSPEDGSTHTWENFHIPFPNMTWESVPGAVEYNIVIEPSNSTNPNSRNTTISENGYYFLINYYSRAQDTYSWKVRAKDDTGVYGPWSETRTFDITLY